MKDKKKTVAHLKDTPSSNIIHTSKKHRNQAIVIITLVVACFVTAGILGLYFFGDHNNQPVEIEETTFDVTLMDASVRPAGEVLTGITIPDSTDADAMKACALKLYKAANYNLQHDDKFAYAVNTNTEVLGVKTGGIIYAIKNGDEFFKGEYFYVPKDAAGALAKSASPQYTNYGDRLYYNITTKVGHQQRSTKLDYSTKSNGQIIFGVDWTTLYSDVDVEEIPQEFASSKKDYKYYNHLWDEDTIKSASVEYNAAEGYYKLVVELDTSIKKTTKDGIQALRDGAGDKTATYTEIIETVEIWDNGRYKTFNTYDSWHANKIHGTIFSVDSVNDYKTTFYYDDYSLNINNYQYAKEYIESLTK